MMIYILMVIGIVISIVEITSYFTTNDRNEN